MRKLIYIILAIIMIIAVTACQDEDTDNKGTSILGNIFSGEDDNDKKTEVTRNIWFFNEATFGYIDWEDFVYVTTHTIYITEAEAYNFFPEIIELLDTIEHAHKAITASVTYDPDGEVYFVDILIEFITYDREIKIVHFKVGEYSVGYDQIFEPIEEIKISRIQDFEITAFISSTVHSENFTELNLGAQFIDRDIPYSFRLNGFEIDEGRELLTELINIVDYINRPPNFFLFSDPVIIPWKHTPYSFDSLRNDEFGNFVPEILPDGVLFNRAERWEGGSFQECTLMVTFDIEDQFLSSNLRWSIVPANERDIKRLVPVANPAAYDFSLYSGNLWENVPIEYLIVFFNPVFDANELTYDAINARMHLISKIDATKRFAGQSLVFTDADDEIWIIEPFSVMFDDVIIRIRGVDFTPDQVWELFEDLLNRHGIMPGY